jgi:hypothetical protein
VRACVRACQARWMVQTLARNSDGDLALTGEPSFFTGVKGNRTKNFSVRAAGR